MEKPLEDLSVTQKEEKTEKNQSLNETNTQSLELMMVQERIDMDKRLFDQLLQENKTLKIENDSSTKLRDALQNNLQNCQTLLWKNLKLLQRK